MKLSQLYANKSFKNIIFNDGLNLVLAKVTKKLDLNKDSHNLGKTTLIAVIDFMLLKELKEEHIFKTYKEKFTGYVFFLEILLNSGEYLTIRRAVDTPTKISFKTTKVSANLLNEESWNKSNVGIDKAGTELNEYIAFDILTKWQYRKSVTYFLRSQKDYNDVFQLSKFSKGKDIDWKPFMFDLLGFNGSLLNEKYEIDCKITEQKSFINGLKNKFAVDTEEVDKIKGVIDFITRADFRGNIYDTNTVSSGYFSKLSLNQIVAGIHHFSVTLFSSYSWWILLPIVITIATLWKKDKRKLVHISLPLVLMGFGLSGYLSWPVDLGSQATTVRFYIPAFITIAPLLCLGLWELMTRLYSSIKLLGIKYVGYPAVGFGFITIPLIIAILNFPSVSVNKFDLISRLYSTMINQVEPNSIITCYSDSSCFALLYEQTVNAARPDVDIAPIAYPLVKRKMDDHKLSKFTYENNPYLMLDIVSWNIGKRPVYAVDISQYYWQLFGIDNAFMFYIPQGYYGKLDRVMPATLPSYAMSLSEINTHPTISDADLMQRFLILSLSQTHMTNAYTLLKIGNRSEAQKELNTAVNMVYGLTSDEKKNGLQARAQIERILADPNLLPVQK